MTCSPVETWRGTNQKAIGFFFLHSWHWYAQVSVTTPSSKKKKNKNKKKKASASAVSNPFDALQDNDDSITPSAAAGETVTSPTTDDAPSGATTTATKSKSKKKKKGKTVVKSMEEMSVEEFERSLQQMNQQ